MARVGVHIEAELLEAAVNLNKDDQETLYDDLCTVLETYFDKFYRGAPASTAKVKSLIIDYGKLASVAKSKLPTEDGTILCSANTGYFRFVRLGGKWREIDNMLVPDEVVERYFEQGEVALLNE